MTNEELQDLLRQAGTAERQGNYEEAERLSQQVLASLSSTGITDQADKERTTLHSEAARMLGAICRMRGDYPKALEHQHAALHISEQMNDQVGIAKALGNMGTVYWNLSDYSKALEYYGKALGIAEELGDKAGVAIWLGNIGNVQLNLSDYPKALFHYLKALGIDEELSNKAGVATWLGNIGRVHLNLSDYPNALEYILKALNLNEELGNKSGIAAGLGSIGTVHGNLYNYPEALEYFLKALNLNEELGNKSEEASNLGNIGSVHGNLSNYPKALEYFGKALHLAEVLGNKAGVSGHLGNIGTVHLELRDYPQALEYYVKALSLAEELGNKKGVAIYLGNVGLVHMKLCDYSNAQEYLDRGLSMHEELGTKSEVVRIKTSLGELFANDANPNHDESKAETFLLDAISISQELGTKQYEAHKTLAELFEKQERWKESHYHMVKYFTLKEEVQSEEARNKALLLEQQKQIAEREKEIAIAKAASDAQMSATTKLLHKVLPQSVATRMIEGEEEIADYFPQVSILFADIAGFTPISADMPAIVVVRFLNYVFAEFDRIIKKHGCEKIKTIGDGYMAVCGAPLACEDHAERLAAAALEMQETITVPESIREYMPSGIKLGVRIGLHTGSVVAGVIGEERFVYDIYSDAVNTAARMESHGEENKIHVSNDFFRHLQNRFAMTKNTTHGFVFEKRGEMEIKGKGMMRTYFLREID